MSDIEIDALKKVLKMYGETSKPVSQGFYQGLCEKAIKAINQLQTELDELEDEYLDMCGEAKEMDYINFFGM